MGRFNKCCRRSLSVASERLQCAPYRPFRSLLFGYPGGLDLAGSSGTLVTLERPLWPKFGRFCDSAILQFRGRDTTSRSFMFRPVLCVLFRSSSIAKAVDTGAIGRGRSNRKGRH